MTQTRSTLIACGMLLFATPLVAADVGVGPGAPGDLVATPGPGAGALTLAWTAASSLTGVTSYRVYHLAADGSRGALVAETDGATTSFTERGLANGATVAYVVTAVDLVGEGPASGAASATTFTTPDAPQSVTAAPGPVGTLGEIDVAWDAPANDGGLAVTGYRVYRDGELVAALAGDARSWNDTGLDLARDHLYAISAVNDAGEGLQSDVACAMASPWGVAAGAAPACLDLP